MVEIVLPWPPSVNTYWRVWQGRPRIGHEGQYDRIVMNPPFSEGRWQAHIQHAYELLASGGRMAAVIPSSARGKELPPGCKYHDVFDFPGTSIQVVLMTANKD